MKTEVKDLSETKKDLVVEIPSAIVDAEIDRVARDYTRSVRLPGFRPGKVPQRIVRQRFHERILHDVAHDLIPRAVDEALRERGLEPVDTPNIRDVSVEEGQPLKFTASFETIPPLDPGDYASLTLRRSPVNVEPEDVERALGRLRERLARYEPVEDRPAERSDTVVIDLKRRRGVAPGEPGSPERPTEWEPPVENLNVEIGGAANPPGFDEQLTGTKAGEEKQFTVTYPADYAVTELAGTDVEYAVTVKSLKRRVLPELDDDFAKDVGDFDSLERLREQVQADLRRHAADEAERQLRAELLAQLASRVPFPAPGALVDREMNRRVEDFARRLVEQQIDPARANINWEEWRERQREGAESAVRATLMLDEVARRESLVVTSDDIDREVATYAERNGQQPAAVRARLEKEGGIARVHAGLRRDRAIDFLVTHATIVE